jgi:RNase adaptor protein for sRNA GlmZ degradation
MCSLSRRKFVLLCNPDVTESRRFRQHADEVITNTEHSGEQSTQIIGSCFCALGKHRSVAFVEELARKQWPDDWDVEIHHRDVDQDKSKRTNRQHKQSRKDNQKFVSLEEE